jgi:lysophospholipase L1-like esterase
MTGIRRAAYRRVGVAAVVLALSGCAAPGPISGPSGTYAAHSSGGASGTQDEPGGMTRRGETPPAASRLQPEPLTASGRPLRVVALGDSVPAGSACGCDPYPDLVADTLGSRTGRPASADNLAFGGADSSDVLAQVGDPTIESSLATADVVLIEIGANDFDESLADDPDCSDASCQHDVLAQLRPRLTAIVRTVQEVQRTSDARIVVMGYWNVFRDGAVGRSRGEAYVAGSAALTDAVNMLTAEVARATDCLYADTLSPFKGPDGQTDATFALSADGDHPNARGHRLIADAVVEALADAGALGG